MDIKRGGIKSNTKKYSRRRRTLSRKSHKRKASTITRSRRNTMKRNRRSKKYRNQKHLLKTRKKSHRKRRKSTRRHGYIPRIQMGGTGWNTLREFGVAGITDLHNQEKTEEEFKSITTSSLDNEGLFESFDPVLNQTVSPQVQGFGGDLDLMDYLRVKSSGRGLSPYGGEAVPNAAAVTDEGGVGRVRRQVDRINAKEREAQNRAEEGNIHARRRNIREKLALDAQNDINSYEAKLAAAREAAARQAEEEGAVAAEAAAREAAENRAEEVRAAAREKKRAGQEKLRRLE